MENETHDPAKSGEEEVRGEAVDAQSADAAPSLSDKGTPPTPEEAGAIQPDKVAGGEETKNDDNDPGLVAKMTAKGALSGF